MKIKNSCILAVVSLVVFLSANAFAGSIILKNGNVINGNIHKEDDKSVTLYLSVGTTLSKVKIYKSYIKEIKKEPGDTINPELRPKPIVSDHDFSALDKAIDTWMENNKEALDASDAARSYKREKPGLGQVVESSLLKVILRIPTGWTPAYETNVLQFFGPDEGDGFRLRGTLSRVKAPAIPRVLQMRIANATTLDELPSWDPYASMDMLLGKNMVPAWHVRGTFKAEVETAIHMQTYIWHKKYLYTLSFSYRPNDIGDYQKLFKTIAHEMIFMD